MKARVTVVLFAVVGAFTAGGCSSQDSTATDLADFAGLDVYCAAAADYAANYVFPWDGFEFDSPQVQAHYERLDILVAAAPPEHVDDWAAIVDIEKRNVDNDVTAEEVATLSDVVDRRIRPDILEFCSINL